MSYRAMPLGSVFAAVLTLAHTTTASGTSAAVTPMNGLQAQAITSAMIALGSTIIVNTAVTAATLLSWSPWLSTSRPPDAPRIHLRKLWRRRSPMPTTPRKTKPGTLRP